jgi:hypothetical protein
MSQLTAETLVGRMKGIPDFIFGTIVEILESYDTEVMVAEGFIFERCPVCPACHRQGSTKFHLIYISRV